MKDRQILLIKSLKLYTRIGCKPEEQDKAQKIEIDLSIEIENKERIKSLKDTICYDNLCKNLSLFVTSKNWTLIEELADSSIAFILDNYPTKSIRIRIKKFSLKRTSWVGIEITRQRAYP